MSSITLQGIFATFGGVDSTFGAANNRLSADIVGTSNRNLVVSSPPPSVTYNGIPATKSFEYRLPASGQHVRNDPTDGLIFSIYQPNFRFDIPIDSIKNLLSATITFQTQRIYYTNPATIDRFNIRVVDYMRRYEPNTISTFPLLGSFGNDVNSNSILIANPSQYINSNTFRIVFSEIAQENNTQRLILPASGDAGMDFTGFLNVQLGLNYDAYSPEELSAGTGFKHFEFASSGLAQRPGKTGNSVYVSDSGLLSLANTENIGSLILYPGSGHQLKTFDLICGGRCLRFPAVAATKNVELVIPSRFPGTGIITVHRWVSQPIGQGSNFSSVGTISTSGGVINLAILTGERWFHFTMYDPERHRELPIRLAEKDGRLLAVSF